MLNIPWPKLGRRTAADSDRWHSGQCPGCHPPGLPLAPLGLFDREPRTGASRAVLPTCPAFGWSLLTADHQRGEHRVRPHGLTIHIPEADAGESTLIRSPAYAITQRALDDTLFPQLNTLTSTFVSLLQGEGRGFDSLSANQGKPEPPARRCRIPRIRRDVTPNRFGGLAKPEG